jgi:hypothetical protein
MSKIELDSVQAGFNLSRINNNFDRIEEALNYDVLWRDNPAEEPNAMLQPLDMDGNPIINAGHVSVSGLTINGVAVEVGGVTSVATAQVFEFVAAEGQTTFDVSPLEPTTPSIEMEVNGFALRPSSLSVVGSVVTFPALVAGDEVVFRIFTRDIGAAHTAGDINWTPVSTGSVTVTVAAALERTLSLSEFNADPTGTIDSSTQFLAAAAAAVGRKLYIPKGTYILNTPQLTAAYHDIEFIGEGEDTIFKIANAVNVPVLRIEGGYNLKFKNLVIDGNGANQTLTTARSLRIGTGASDIEFENVVFKDSYYDNVFMDGTLGICSGIKFHKCKFINSIDANSANVRYTDCENVSFTNCLFTEWAYDAISMSWFQVNDGGLLVQNCEFLNTKSILFAIETVGSGAAKEFRLRNAVINNNIFDGGNNVTGGSGISGVSDSVTITGNVWRNSGGASHRTGVESTGKDWTINNNVFDNGAVVVASTTGAVTENLTISDNIIKNRAVSGYGVAIGGVAATEILDVTVTGNVIDLTGNTSSGGGIYLGTYGSPAVCKRITVANNVITKTDAASGIGIRIRALGASETLRVFNNTIAGTFQGIRTDDTATDVEVYRNHLGGVATALSLNHTTGVWRIYDNFFSKTMELVSADRGDASVTLIRDTDSPIQVFNTPLTVNRTITLSSTYATRGAQFKVVRTAAATGASTLSVGGLKSLAVGQWATVVYNGTTWILLEFGSL